MLRPCPRAVSVFANIKEHNVKSSSIFNVLPLPSLIVLINFPQQDMLELWRNIAMISVTLDWETVRSFSFGLSQVARAKSFDPSEVPGLMPPSNGSLKNVAALFDLL